VGKNETNYQASQLCHNMEDKYVDLVAMVGKILENEIGKS
jgi:hypothetical protein